MRLRWELQLGGATDQQPAAPLSRLDQRRRVERRLERAVARRTAEHQLHVTGAGALGDVVNQDALLALVEVGDEAGPVADELGRLPSPLENCTDILKSSVIRPEDPFGRSRSP